MSTHTSLKQYTPSIAPNALVRQSNAAECWYNEGADHTIECVREWHELFGVHTNHEPTVDHDATNALRIALLEEELGELGDALRDRDPVATLDALTDLQYILDGTYLAFGLGGMKRLAFDEVHRSNMSKLGSDGLPIRRADGKVLKGPNYSKPNLRKFFK